MKTILTFLAVFVFSALVLAPVEPKKYPPPPVLEQRREIALQEQIINTAIQKIEYRIAIDSTMLNTSDDDK